MDRVCIGFGSALDRVWIGFGFFVFFWTGLIVSPYHSKCYRQSVLLKIGFGWYKRVTSVKGKFCSARGRCKEKVKEIYRKRKDLARFDSFLFDFCSFWVRFGFVFFAFFWTVLIVSPYHRKCYRQSGLLKIGFVWHKRV